RVGVQCDRSQQILQICQRIDFCLRLCRRLRTGRLRILREAWLDGRPCNKDGDCDSGNVPRAKTPSVFVQITLLAAALSNLSSAIDANGPSGAIISFFAGEKSVLDLGASPPPSQRTEIPTAAASPRLRLSVQHFYAACFALFVFLGSVKRTARTHASQRMAKNSVNETVRLAAGKIRSST